VNSTSSQNVFVDIYWVGHTVTYEYASQPVLDPAIHKSGNSTGREWAKNKDSRPPHAMASCNELNSSNLPRLRAPVTGTNAVHTVAVRCVTACVSTCYVGRFQRHFRLRISRTIPNLGMMSPCPKWYVLYAFARHPNCKAKQGGA
jgi:hypothetical protein